MKMDPLISIVVPVFNVDRWLDDCVKSVLAQTYVSFELILVDDGSPDHCPIICDEWAKRDSRIKVIHKINEGRSEARNVGVDSASGEYVTFVDPDDFLEPDYLSYLWDILVRHPECQYSECSMLVWRDGHLLRVKDYDHELVLERPDAVKAVLYDKMRVSCCAKLLPIGLAKRIRFPKGRIHEDAYTICEFLCSINKIVVSHKPLYVYRIRENSTVSSPYNRWNVIQHLEATEHLIDVVLKNYPQMVAGCRRFDAYAHMRALKYMSDVYGEDLVFRAQLRVNALQNFWLILRDKNATARDVLGLVSLKFGMRCFFTFWKIYTKIRIVFRKEKAS